jgi:hypothetical protein
MSIFQNHQGVVAQTPPVGCLEGYVRYLIPKIIFVHIEIRDVTDNSAWDSNFYKRPPAPLPPAGI